MNVDLKPHHAGGGSWPEPHHLTLLQACLLPPDEAMPAWRRWRGMVPLDALDVASWKLLPLAGWNLAKHLPDDAALQEAAGFQRYHWAKNQKQLHSLQQLAAAALGEYDRPVALKGIVLAFDFYPQPGLRPMEDIDLLLTPNDCDRLLGRLCAEGWEQEGDHPYSPAGGRAGTAHGMRRKDGLQLDLHTLVLHRNPKRILADRFRAHSVSLRTLAPVLRVPAPEHLLLHVLAHGYEWAPSIPARWMADAFWIQHKAGGAFDWDEFLRMSGEAGENIAAEKTLSLLRETLRFPVPDEVLHSLRRHQAGWTERFKVRATTLHRARHPLWRLAWDWQRLSMIEPPLFFPKRIAWLVRFYFRQWTRHAEGKPVWRVGCAKAWKNIRIALGLAPAGKTS